MPVLIGGLRTYLKARIVEVLADAIEIDDPFGTRDVSTTEIKYGYKIFFGETSIENRAGAHYIDTIPVTINIYYQDSGRTIDLFDSLYDRSHEVKDNIIDPTKCNDSVSFTTLFGNSISVGPIDTNDRGVQSSINLTCTRYTDYLNE